MPVGVLSALLIGVRFSGAVGINEQSCSNIDGPKCRVIGLDLKKFGMVLTVA